MVIVDTSIWARHLRVGDRELGRLLRTERVLVHPFVLTELASRVLGNRDEILALLRTLPPAPWAGNDEVNRLIELRDLAGRGLALVDLHLLAAALIAPAKLWSSDRRLQQAAVLLEVDYSVA